MTPRQKLTEQVVREYADNRSMTLAGGLRIDDLKAAAQTDEEPFLLERRRAEVYDGGLCLKCSRPTGRQDDVDVCKECW